MALAENHGNWQHNQVIYVGCFNDGHRILTWVLANRRQRGIIHVNLHWHRITDWGRTSTIFDVIDQKYKIYKTGR